MLHREAGLGTANNRAEESIGTAHDFWTAYREGAFGPDTACPFIGWLVMVEDAPASRSPAKRETSLHYPIFPEFRGASYLDRYDILCKKLVRENLYTAACTLASPREAVTTGAFSGHVAAEAPRG